MKSAFMEFLADGGDILLWFGGFLIALLAFGGVMTVVDGNHAKEMYSICLESGGTPRDCKDFAP